MITESITRFFQAEYPLVKLFDYGKELLFYDAKPHFAFIMSHEEAAVLIDFLKEMPEKEIIRTKSAGIGVENVKALLVKFSGMKKNGVFIKGPAAEISTVDRAAIKERLRYYDQNIVLRKFSLGVTEDCNYRCTYCKKTIANGYKGHSKENLSEENACKAIDYYFHKYTSVFNKLSPDKKELLLQIIPPGLSWYGGEPFLNFDLIQNTARYFKGLPWEKFHIRPEELRFAANTNLSVMTGEMLGFLVDNRVHLYASLDGPAEEHDKCRVFEDGRGTFETAYGNLMKIKEFDEAYFRQRVSIFGVLADGHDHARCVDFTRSLGALHCQHVTAEFTGAFVPDADSVLDDYRRSMPDRLAEFKRTASAEAGDEDIDLGHFRHLFPFARLNYDKPAGNNSLQASLTCPMAFDNLMVSATGQFLICHKVDDSMPIGDCDAGLDLERLTEVYRRYNAAINNEECKSCWNVNFCSVCAAGRMAANTFVNPARKECDLFRLQSAHAFLCFIHLSLEHPALLQKIFDRRNDKRSFIGVVDINDF